MKTTVMVIILFFFALNAKTAETKVENAFDRELIKDEWAGADRFVANLNSEKVDICNFIVNQSLKYQDASFVVRRLLLLAERTRCKQFSNLVSSFLKSSDALVRASAIRLASTMSEKEKAVFKKSIENLKKKDNDPAVQDAASVFLKD